MNVSLFKAFATCKPTQWSWSLPQHHKPVTLAAVSSQCGCWEKCFMEGSPGLHRLPGKDVPGSIPSPGRMSLAPSPSPLGKQRPRAAGGAGQGLPSNPAAHPAPLSEGTPSTSEPYTAPTLPAGGLRCSQLKRVGKTSGSCTLLFLGRLHGPGAPAGVMSSLLPTCIYTVFSCDSLSSTSTTACTLTTSWGVEKQPQEHP